jgi:hypothetical protein
MRLTPMEHMLICALKALHGDAMPEDWLRPQMKAAATRLRAKGLLSMKNDAQVRLTKRGRAVAVTNGVLK